MAAAVEAVSVPVSAQAVANAFVQQYYHILRHSPGHVHRFYQEISKLGRPEEDGSMSITTTLQAINEKIMSLNYGDFGTEIKSVDAQDSHNGGVHVLVTGYLTGKNSLQKFAQTFFLAPQENGYYVLNDMFRRLDDANLTPALVNDSALPVPEESVPVLEDNPSEKSTQSVEEAADEVYNPSQNGDVTIVEDEVPVPEVVDQVQDDVPKVKSITEVEEGPKKSYASIVMHLKDTAATFSPPPPARKALPKPVEPVNPPAAPASPTDRPASVVDSVENENNQEDEADGHSIYIKGLPMNATAPMLEEVFKQFGSIKTGGIQVRSNRHQGFCFGFVEFEEANSVQKALEASPVVIGGRQAFVEEKRSTNSRGNNRGRFQPGRGSGFRNDGIRGRGNYVGGRGYNNRSDFNGRNDFSNRNGSRGGGPSNRDGYHHRPENFNGNVGRPNQTGGSGLTNGNPKNMTPRVSATA